MTRQVCPQNQISELHALRFQHVGKVRHARHLELTDGIVLKLVVIFRHVENIHEEQKVIKTNVTGLLGSTMFIMKSNSSGDGTWPRHSIMPSRSPVSTFSERANSLNT